MTTITTVYPEAQGHPLRTWRAYRARIDINPRSKRRRWAWALYRTGQAVR